MAAEALGGGRCVGPMVYPVKDSISPRDGPPSKARKPLSWGGLCFGTRSLTVPSTVLLRNLLRGPLKSHPREMRGWGHREVFLKQQVLPSRPGRDLGADPGLGIVEGEVARSRSPSKAVAPHSAGPQRFWKPALAPPATSSPEILIRNFPQLLQGQGV